MRVGDLRDNCARLQRGARGYALRSCVLRGHDMKRVFVAALLTFVGWGAAAQAPATNAELPASTRLAMPGPEHAWLEPLVGDWSVEMRVFPGGGAAPIVSADLRATRRWALGGRYLHEQLRGTFGGNPSARDAVLGYNRLDGRFELVTTDTFEPGQMIYFSRGDETAQRFSLHGESTEAGMGAEPTGRRRALRFEIEIRDRNYNVQRIFVRYPGRQEFLFVEQRFTRRR